jgi:hypothetical protein
MDVKIGDEIWIISFEIENDFYLVSKQTIVEITEEQVECEDDFNTFVVSYKDIYKTKSEALSAMIDRLVQLQAEQE